MPRAKSKGRLGAQGARNDNNAGFNDIAAFLECLESIPSTTDGESQPPLARPAKRAKTAGVLASVTVAREHLAVTLSSATGYHGPPIVSRREVGEVLDVRLREAGQEGPMPGEWQLQLKPRSNYRTRGFVVLLPLGETMISAELRAALRVAEVQAFDPGEEGCLWAAIDLSAHQNGESTELRMSIEVRWNGMSTAWGSKGWNSNLQQALRDEIFQVWYPELRLRSDGEAPSWSPQDFYEAAYVPDKIGDESELNSMDIPGLKATLYPFQTRAIQWLLQREGVKWGRNPSSNKPGIQAYAPQDITEPISFTEAADVDGNAIYLSSLLGAALKDTSPIRQLQEIRGGILAEEMGLGKTLEIIALILLHRRPEVPVMLYDYFLGRQLLTTSATLIIAPTPLLDQWISELNRHAPGLKVMIYPGVKAVSKAKDDDGLSAESLAEQDVVITTYEVLRREIWAAADEPTRSLRNEKQYERIRSPLVQLSWWRVCIDEAQMVENWTNNAAKLARKIPRVNAWGVTGTPVKDDVKKDLRGLLLFLRHEPYASNTKIWNALTTFDKDSFRKIFNSISMRHSKSHVRNEIAIPRQRRYVITMPFTAVEEQHYQGLVSQLAETCGLDAKGNPLQGDWDPEDPAVQRHMRVALDRLRQTVLHPEVGGRNRRAFGQKAGPMRTVTEVLDAMLEQADTAMRAEQRALLSAKVGKGQVIACQTRAEDALAVWSKVVEESVELETELRAQLKQELEAESRRVSERDEDEEGHEDVTALRTGELRRRLRSVLEIQHRAIFFCGNAYFSMKSKEETVPPDSDEFKALEAKEVAAYDRAKEVRREILQESHGKAKKLMERLTKAAQQQAFAVIPAFEEIDKSGIETRRIAEALEELNGALDDQAGELDNWREHVIQLLLKPLVDEESEETTGEEYGDSTKLQDEILVYLQALRIAVADRHAAITGQKNFLVEHEMKVAARMAAAGEGPFPEKFLQLVAICVKIKPPFAERDPLTSMRGIVSELRVLAVQLRNQVATGSARASTELALVTNLLKSTLDHQTEQTKAAVAMDKEIERFMDTVNARIEYYRQLQEVSDTVAEYEGSLEPPALEAALKESEKQEANLQEKLNAAAAKHRYLVFLKEQESNSGEQRMCIICQSAFSVGVLTVCGHLFCKECITLWFRAHRTCPMCKKRLTQSNLYDITLKPQQLKVHSEAHDGGGDNPKQTDTARPEKVSTIYSEFHTDKLNEIKDIDLDGPSFTTKVDMLVRHLLWLRQSDPGAKSIVFSQYKEFLDVLALAFRRYRIGYTSFEKANGIASFKEDPGTEVFLLHARAHASGLNLVNASHVFLCEPLLNTALELQAIARVDRIGQESETTVWLYIVEGTVEESIHGLSVQRRMEHMGRQNTNGTTNTNNNSDKGKSKNPTPELLDAKLDEANALEMQQAHLSKLMGKDGISGEAVDKADLWTCLFGHLHSEKDGGGGRSVGGGEGAARPVSLPTRRFLAAEAAEGRMEGRKP
ncbi:SNF2 family N-terminal domain-containing protein [Chaetomium sp. MPI-SDFR-AT-0129]|nr:SNF2 family N-terminal domain-containing protein [Chaetomium sp. MPI-SDFR-AT-0129]